MISDFPFNFIIIPAIIIYIAVKGARQIKNAGGDSGRWYRNLHKPKWTPSGQLIGEIWTFLYVITGGAIMWFWNVPAFSWFHIVGAAILLVNAYYHYTWNRVFFGEHDLPKSYKIIQRVFYTAILSLVAMAILSPIGAFLMLPYIIWLGIAMRINKQILDLNSPEKK